MDEAARVDQELLAAVRPTLSATNGRFFCLSTPSGRRGFYWEFWEHGEGWHRIEVKGSDCPRISKAFLEEELATLGPFVFQQEYECAFLDPQTSVFSSDLIQAAMVDDFEPFLHISA